MAQARRLGIELGIVLGIFVAASLIGALIWDSVADLPRWTQSATGVQGIQMGPVQSQKTISIDAGYLFVATPIALVIGIGLSYWRRRTPVTTVVLLAVASILAAALMERFGFWIGPGDPLTALQAAKTGATAPVRLQVQATGVLLAWPAAALLGSFLVLLLAPAHKFEPIAVPEHEIAGGVLEVPN